MYNTPTINKYLFRMFAGYILITSFVIIGILCISNFFDIIHKFKSDEVPLIIFWKMVSFKVPHLFNETCGLIGFISTILFLRKLSVSNEMLAIIASGLPSWRIFLIPVITTFFFGVIILVVFSPLSTLSLIEYERLEAIVTNRPQNNVVVSQTGIFFYEKFENSHKIIRAKSINSEKKELTGLTILVVDSENNFLERIDAESAILDKGYFHLLKPNIENKSRSEIQESLLLSTNLTVDQLIQTFTSPEMIPIWNLKSSIDKFAKSGLSTTNYEIYYYKELFKPLSMAAMVFLACWFIALNVRDTHGPQIIVYGLVIGLSTFFILEITTRLMAYNGFNIVLACLLPALAIIFVSNFVILHFQEA